MTEGVKVTGDVAYGRLHLHSAYAHVALALSQLFQSGGKVVESGEVVRLEARYQSARVGARIGDLTDIPSVFRVLRVKAVVAKVFNRACLRQRRYFFCGRGAGWWSARTATGRSFFFDPFEEALENATRISSEAPVWRSPGSDAALVTGGVMTAWKEEKGMGIEGRKGNGWSHCSQKVFLLSNTQKVHFLLSELDSPSIRNASE